MYGLRPENERAIDCGRPLGVPLRVDVRGVLMLMAMNFVAMLALCLWARPEIALVGTGAVALTATVLLQFSAVAHEFAHLLVARATGQPASALVLNILGGYVFVDAEDEAAAPLGAVALYVAAGPLASLLLAVGFGLLAGYLRVSAPLPAMALGLASTLNVALLVMNLLPIYPLDGGRLLRVCTLALQGRGAPTTSES